MPEFIAIPVGKGDAFFLNTDEKKILVDGGRSRNKFPGKFRSTTNETELDVVVCTHADADHTRGIIGLLNPSSNITCDQVWLPAIWADRLESLLKDPISFFDELAQNIEDLDEKELPDSIYQFGDGYFAENLRDKEELSQSDGEATDKERIHEWLLKTEEEEKNKIIEFFYPAGEIEINDIEKDSLAFDINFNYIKKAKLFYEGVIIANEIKQIAKRAVRRGTRIRWFEYHGYANTNKGGEDFLKPLNSFEPKKIRTNRYNTMQYLGLSTADKLSLVFTAPMKENQPPVLFSAESRFGFHTKIPWEKNILITAPHHGAEANEIVYEKVEDYEDENGRLNPVWVRSDSANSYRPCKEYINASGDKFCTICNNQAKSKKQPVKLRCKDNKWKPLKNVRKCQCK